jgi:beta-mannosidase
VASWASLDYFGRWKALHYAAKRFYAPLLLSVENDGKRMSVHVTSDLTALWEGTLRWQLVTLDGNVLESGQSAVSAALLADSGVCMLDFGAAISDLNSRQTVLVCELWHGQERLSWCVNGFVPDKHLMLTDPGLTCAVSLSDEILTFELAAVSLARFVELSLTEADVVFSNNYFDLPAGMTIRVTAPLPSGWIIEQAQRALTIRSLYNTYA